MHCYNFFVDYFLRTHQAQALVCGKEFKFCVIQFVYLFYDLINNNNNNIKSWQ